MAITETLYRRNPSYKICTGRELMQINPAFATIPGKQDAFFLVHNEQYLAKDLVPIDIPTASCLYATEQPAQLNHVESHKKDNLLNRLLFDNIVQVGNHNHFSGGPEYVSSDHPVISFETPATKIAALTINAIKYAWHLRDLTIDQLTVKLYKYGTTPKDNILASRISSPHKVLLWLGKKHVNALTENYTKLDISSSYKYWHYWQHHAVGNSRDLRFKLYISPIPKETPEVFRKVINICNTYSVPAFKIGSTSLGIHRPDKLILYFKDQYSAFLLASHLLPVLSGFSSHGVPFTFPLSENGIISFGIDPTEEYNASYRQYVARVIAETIKLYSFQNKKLNVKHILLKLNLCSIDVQKWNTINTYQAWNY